MTRTRRQRQGDPQGPSRRRVGALLVFLLPVVGCSGLLEVEDPARYTSDELDGAPLEVANGVEGKLHRAIPLFVVGTGLLSDELKSSGVWPEWERIDHGGIAYGNSPILDRAGPDPDPFATLLQARWFAGDAWERFERLGLDETDPSLLARVTTVHGLADLYLAQGFCEGPAVPDGPAVTDTDLYRQAEATFTRVIESAAGEGVDTWVRVSRAGRARARLMLGDHAGALADAASVPDGWRYAAVFSGNDRRQYNDVVYVATGSVTLREKWWDKLDQYAGVLLDPWSGEPDPRVPVLYDGSLGLDGVTPLYTQGKYLDLADDIPMLDAEEMRLIEAEVHWQQGNLGTALDILDGLRVATGLSPLPDTDDPDLVLRYLLRERFAEGFLEGQRLTDLHRLGLVQTMVDAGDFVGSLSPRPTKFPLLDDEARFNPNIEDDPGLRCLPMSR